jgi:hypothetical protein
MSELDRDQIEGLVGAAAELARQGGYINGQNTAAAYQALTSTHMGQVGAQAVQSLAQYAPGAIVALGVYAPPAALVLGVGYGVYKLCEWLADEF